MCSDSAASPREAGAPEDEMEITPEMIEAGAVELASYHGSEWESLESGGLSIYKAMTRARLPNIASSIRQRMDAEA
jgi:hypothetical protein